MTDSSIHYSLKLIPWLWKQVTMAERSMLVKSVLTSIVIDYNTVLDNRMEVLIKIDTIRRVFLWVAGWAWRHLHSSRS
jgi:hypothetical protein